MSEPDDLHALTARYFDGELTGDDVERALDHLTTCAACQRELGDHVGLEVAMGRGAADLAPVADAPSPIAPVIAITAARPRRRAAVVGAVVAAVAVAAIALVWLRTRPRGSRRARRRWRWPRTAGSRCGSRRRRSRRTVRTR
ncbi:MAG: zf-HC2 domain-containing protein [Myxococcales bacterium]|nr:zf-HC2 domain-containing protein [Myxococcales bacterium]